MCSSVSFRGTPFRGHLHRGCAAAISPQHCCHNVPLPIPLNYKETKSLGANENGKGCGLKNVYMHNHLYRLHAIVIVFGMDEQLSVNEVCEALIDTKLVSILFVLWCYGSRVSWETFRLH